ncbi:hypothetical protein Tco_1261416 [Tanacetum coccineum]
MIPIPHPPLFSQHTFLKLKEQKTRSQRRKDTEQQDRGNINKTQSKATLNEPSSLGTSSGSGPRRQETMGDTIAQTGFENVSKTSNDSLLAGVNTPRNLSSSGNYKFEKKGQETREERRVKNSWASDYPRGWLSRRVESSDDEGLGEEDASKQGRIADIDADAGINLVSTHFDADTDMFGVHDLVGDEVVVETEVASKDVNLSVDEVTLAQLAALKSVKPKADKVMTRVKDKNVDLKKPMKKKELITLDEEIASKLQAKFDEEVRLAREKAEKEEEANIVSWDNVQAMIDADYQMAQQMQVEEQEKLSIEEKSKLFVQLLEARKKHFAAMRAQEKRNKPPTKAQKRKTMSTYLKNMAGYKHNQLKNKSFDDIQKLFDKAMKRVNTFVDMDTELVEGSEVRAEGSETRAEGSSKRAGEDLQQESTKKQKVDEDRETAELQSLMEVIPEEEEVAIDAIPLATKPASIVDWKIHKEGKKSYYQIIRADGSSKMYLVFSHMLKSFDRKDLETLYKLVKAKYGSTRSVDNLSMKKLEILKKNIKFRGGLLGLKVFIELLLLRVNVAGTKLQLLKVTTAERVSTVREWIKTGEKIKID